MILSLDLCWIEGYTQLVQQRLLWKLGNQQEKTRG